MQEAASAAAALDAMTRSKGKRKVKRKPKGGVAATTPKPPLPKAFQADTPFMWNTIEAFDSPVPGNEAWLWGTESAPAETKNKV